MNGYAPTTKTKKNIRVLKLFLISLIFAAIAVSIAVIGCSYVANRSFKESFFSVGNLKVNNKIRVVQISDLHNCKFGKDNSKLIDRVQKLKPDVIIYTGDCIDSKAASDTNAMRLIASLAETAPAYYIYGNNEVEKYYDVLLEQEALDEKFGFDNKTRDPSQLTKITDPLTEKIEGMGIKVLKNQYDTITVGNTTIDIYGVLTSNPSAFWSYAGDTFNEYLYSNDTRLKITAIHEPVVFEEFTPDTWGDLMLAGHTHAGNTRIPMIGPAYTHDGGLLPERGGHYVYGRYDVQGRPLIVSAGLENKNLLRINNSPEITIIDINKF